MSDTPRRTGDLTPEQLSELVMRRKQGRGPEARPAVIEPEIRRRGATVAPLSFAQQRLWLLDQLTTRWGIDGSAGTTAWFEMGFEGAA